MLHPLHGESPQILQSEIELPVAIVDTIASWRRVFAGRNGADPRDLLRRASGDFWDALKVSGTVYPDSYAVARQEMVDVLQSLAEGAGIRPDDAQAILAELLGDEFGQSQATDSRNLHIIAVTITPAAAKHRPVSAALN